MKKTFLLISLILFGILLFYLPLRADNNRVYSKLSCQIVDSEGNPITSFGNIDIYQDDNKAVMFKGDKYKAKDKKWILTTKKDGQIHKWDISAYGNFTLSNGCKYLIIFDKETPQIMVKATDAKGNIITLAIDDPQSLVLVDE